MMRESLRALPLWVLYGFLYLPILVVVGMSFNANDSAYRWTGFSLQWYPELLRDASILGGLRTTLIVAVGTTAISVVLGTLLAMALERYVPSRALDAAAAAPAVMPDIMLAIGLLAFYTLVGIALSPISVMLAHSVFGITFVAAVVRVRLAGMDPSLEEASRDRFGVTPQINALATLLLLVSFVAVILAQRASRLGDSLRRKGN